MGYSRWVLADLQVHTPADFHQKYGDVGGPAPNDAFADTLIKAHADAGVSVIAVTDHNSLAWYPVLAAAGHRYGVTVFPGIEFNVNKCHLMAIWDCTDDGYKRGQQFLSSLFPPNGPDPLNEKRVPAPTNVGSPLELVKKAATTYGALVLAPHSTAKGIGLFASNVCNTSAQVAQSGYVAGFDVWGQQGLDVLRNPRSQFGDQIPAWFVSGDVRDLETVGQRAVYLKLGTPPTLESLRQAFLMPEQRIRFPERLRTKFGGVPGLRFLDGIEPTWPRLTRIAVNGGFHADLSVELGPGLNAIIGGKGTGKSTTIEILRHVCAAAEPKTRDNRDNRVVNFSANATATLGVVAADQQAYDIVRSGDDGAPQLLRNGVDTGIEVTRRFNISVYGQRELALLPDDQDALRRFLAISANPDLKAAYTEETRLLQELAKTTGGLDELETALEKVVDSEEKLKDLRDQLEVAGRRGAMQQVASSRDLTAVEEEVAALAAWLEDLGPLADQILNAADRPALREHDCVPLALSEATAQAESAIRAAAQTITDAIRMARNTFDPAAREHEHLVQARRHQINVALAEAGLKAPDELARKQRTAAHLERVVADAPAKRDRLSALGAQHDLEIEQLRDVRRSVSQLLQVAAAELTASVGGRVRVVVQPQGDHTELLRLLIALVSGQNVNRDQLAKLADAGPAVLVAALKGEEEHLVKLGASGTTARKMRALSAANLRSIEQCATPDSIVVEINLGVPEQPQWLDVRRVSPGQKATAMLSLALITGTDPLIIDQPEDDLDNRYIYDQVVRQLADVASRRQIIVATHNPNIPILGDAEMILALDATIEQSRVVACGAIDEPAVADAARQILEGGDKAFQDRARRYHSAR
ncbi:TrlF family AAA-like ATPase [Actinoplanes sp. NPDC051851]|uniref:TrlF family AAA-like ATPase n=1 Tax=Actinoplanes sp. NPDC051851 TaxID=3154753 RepID=UPI00342FB202